VDRLSFFTDGRIGSVNRSGVLSNGMTKTCHSESISRFAVPVQAAILLLLTAGCQDIWPYDLAWDTTIGACLAPEDGWDDHPEYWLHELIQVDGVVIDNGVGLPPTPCWGARFGLWDYVPDSSLLQWVTLEDQSGDRWAASFAFPTRVDIVSPSEALAISYQVHAPPFCCIPHGYLLIERPGSGDYLWYGRGYDADWLRLPTGITANTGGATERYRSECGPWDVTTLEVAVDAQTAVLAPGDSTRLGNHAIAMTRSAQIVDADRWKCGDRDGPFYVEVAVATLGE